MAILCGVDIIEIHRIKHSLETLGQAFKDRIFTEREISYCEKRKETKYKSYAARFAAKEAVSKALGTGISEGIKWKEIEVVNDEKGKPDICLSGRAKERLAELGGTSISISLAHCEDYAVAYAVIQAGDRTSD